MIFSYFYFILFVGKFEDNEIKLVTWHLLRSREIFQREKDVG